MPGLLPYAIGLPLGLLHFKTVASQHNIIHILEVIMDKN